MSPEHARGESLDARADVFAGGHHPVGAPRRATPLQGARRGSAARAGAACRDPRAARQGLPRSTGARAIVRRALASRSRRPLPVGERVQRDLEDYLATAGLLASPLEAARRVDRATFGTNLVEERRASERRLPKSVPPPRSSGAVRARTATLRRASRIPSLRGSRAELAIARHGERRSLSVHSRSGGTRPLPKVHDGWIAVAGRADPKQASSPTRSSVFVGAEARHVVVCVLCRRSRPAIAPARCWHAGARMRAARGIVA